MISQKQLFEEFMAQYKDPIKAAEGVWDVITNGTFVAVDEPTRSELIQKMIARCQGQTQTAKTKTKIKLSRSQWEQIGKTAGWIKQANSTRFIQEAFWRISRGEDKAAVLKSMGIRDPSMISQLDILLQNNPRVKPQDLPTAFKTANDESKKVCQRCKGKGRVVEQLMNHGTKTTNPHVIGCPMCSGKGYTDQSDHDSYLHSLGVKPCPHGQSANTKILKKKAGGMGRFSEDLSDTLEARIMIKYREGMDENTIFQNIKSDQSLVQFMSLEEMTDDELMECIRDTIRMINITSRPPR